jgi:molybdate transport system substrate-binding protein
MGEDTMKRWLTAIAYITLLLMTAHVARAQDEITVIGPNIMRGPMEQVIQGYEAKTGRKVKATFGAEVGTRQQIMRGEADVPLVEAPDADVIASNSVVASSETAVANISVGVAVRKGAPKPDISTPEALKRTLLNAKSITFPDASAGAAAGVIVNEALKNLGIVEQLQPKIKPAQGGARAMALVASGDVEIGMTLLPGMTDEGIDIVGTLPREVSPPTIVMGFVSSHAKDPAAAKELLAYFSSPEAAAIYRANKMQPGR